MDVTARSPDVDNAEVGHDDVYSSDKGDDMEVEVDHDAVDHADYNHGSGSEDNDDGKSFLFICFRRAADLFKATPEDNDDGKSFYLSASVVLLTFSKLHTRVYEPLTTCAMPRMSSKTIT
jgi:hypothetical protein